MEGLVLLDDPNNQRVCVLGPNSMLPEDCNFFFFTDIEKSFMFFGCYVMFCYMHTLVVIE